MDGVGEVIMTEVAVHSASTNAVYILASTVTRTTRIVSLVCAAQDTLPDEFPSSAKERKGLLPPEWKKR